MPIHSFGSNDRRDASFRWIAPPLQTVLDLRPIIKRTDVTTTHQAAWHAARKRVQHSYKLPVDTLSAYPECLKVSREPATIVSIDLVIIVLLVFEFYEKMSMPWLTDVLHALHMAARKETKGPDVEGRTHGLLPRHLRP